MPAPKPEAPAPSVPKVAPVPAPKVAPAPAPKPVTPASLPPASGAPVPLPTIPFVALNGLFDGICEMFGPPGRLYTYRSHGIHVCANVACGPDGTAAAVLLRACAIEDGVDVARSRRGAAVRGAALARGPGNLCAALGITMDDNGIDRFDPDARGTLRLGPPMTPTAGPRVGVSQAADRPWRLWLAGRPEVSAYRRSPRAPAAGTSD